MCFWQTEEQTADILNATDTKIIKNSKNFKQIKIFKNFKKPPVFYQKFNKFTKKPIFGFGRAAGIFVKKIPKSSLST